MAAATDGLGESAYVCPKPAGLECERSPLWDHPETEAGGKKLAQLRPLAETQPPKCCPCPRCSGKGVCPPGSISP